MATSLVIVESPTKAKTLKKILGRDFQVLASVGHIIDLPKSKLGVDIENDFRPEYITIRGKGKILKELKTAAEKASKVLLATDPDREGEAISWHLGNVLALDPKQARRVLIHEFTQAAVKRAVSTPQLLDQQKVDSQQARRVLDRLVGYKISPLLWRKLQWGLSAGRVQSVALKLICQRDRAIAAFKPEEYWSLDAALASDPAGEKFVAGLRRWGGQELKIGSRQAMDAVLAELKGLPFEITEVEKKSRSQNPQPPFITSTLQQAASRLLNLSTRDTMRLAQQLYEGVDLGKGPIGLITYMRTDSVRISEEFQKTTREWVAAQPQLGKALLPDVPPIYRSKKNSNVQDAHEAIRPTDIALTPADVQKFLSPAQHRLYELVWYRFLTSQLKPANFDQITVTLHCGKGLFRAVGRTMRDEGFLRAYRSVPRLAPKFSEAVLPALSKGDKVRLEKFVPAQHFTEPPPRFSEASLVKELEENGIGRPSTYATIISTMLDRKYVERAERNLVSTELGRLVVDLLDENFPQVMDVGFTAGMEERLDKIEEGGAPWTRIIREFYDPFEVALKAAEEKMKNYRKEVRETGEKCPKCEKPLAIKRGRFGEFIACTGYPECKYTGRMGKDNQPEAPPEDIDEKCETCGAGMQVRAGRFGKFAACSKYPDCKFTKPILSKIGVACPKPGCGGDLVSRFTRRRRLFYGCSKYPECDFTSWVRPAGENCPTCGSFAVERRKKDVLLAVACSSKACGWERLNEAAAKAEGGEAAPLAPGEEGAAPDPVVAESGFVPETETFGEEDGA